ncbi:MAG TPA: hypothetical protein VN943_16690 [Candidatus Acidoferrum sp.]|nr:hypothetical protein [Candidatus Acidoferrum sp.]
MARVIVAVLLTFLFSLTPQQPPQIKSPGNLFAQATEPSQRSKLPTSEAQAGKKPNVVVFAVKGTPSPAQRPQRPKDMPAFRPLSKEEKISILQGIPGIPNLVTAPTPFLTLSTIHIIDPLGELILSWPKYTNPFYAAYGKFPDDGGDTAAFNAKTVQVDFQADPGNVYLVDFVVYVGPGQPTFDFQITIPGMEPLHQPAQRNAFNHLVAPVWNIPTSGWYSAFLQEQFPSENGGSGKPYYSWILNRVEVTKFVPSSP